MKNLLRLSNVGTPGFPQVPLKRSTLYKWIHVRRHPELFIKVGKAVFVDLDAMDRLVEAGRLG